MTVPTGGGRLAGFLASVLVPVAIALAGHFYSQALKEREIQGQFVELAVDILRDPPGEQSSPDLRKWATKILSAYSGVTMPEEAARSLQTQMVLPDPGQRSPRAAALERSGLEKLLSGDITGAIADLRLAEESQPSFHSVYEIARLLEEREAEFSNPASRREIFSRIVTDYHWRIPPDLKRRLAEAARP